jgi:hypothetical protein
VKSLHAWQSSVDFDDDSFGRLKDFGSSAHSVRSERESDSREQLLSQSTS